MTDEPLLLRGDLTADLADALRDAGRVGWDIETSNLDWATERIGTCQVHARGVGAVVVQMGPYVPVRLAALLADPSVNKVLHLAPFDLAFMRARWGARAANITCTKAAAKMLDPMGGEGAHSLKPVLQRYLGVKISKEQQVTDWCSPELTPEQLAYAANDVLHLLALADVLAHRIAQAGLTDLYAATCAFQPARVELEGRGIPDVFASGPVPVPWSATPRGSRRTARPAGSPPSAKERAGRRDVR